MTVIVPIFLPREPERPRREIQKNGVLYREVLPGDDDDFPWWKVALFGVGIVFGVIAALVAMMKWVFPFMDWLIRL